MERGEDRKLRGRLRHGLRPDWRPLLSFAPEQITEFMWMFRVDLADGTVVEAYKHSSTRRYLYLDASGRVFALVGEATYEEADPIELFAQVVEGGERWASIVRHNAWIDGERITWARSATRHRIPRAQPLFAIRSAGICFEDGTGRAGEPRLFFFGEDDRGRPLEIAAFEKADGGLHVIHSMLLRRRFKELYEEALRWGM